MDNHSVARTFTVRTEEQRQKDLVKIKEYRAIEDEFRQHASAKDFSRDTFALTTRLLHLNPEYYTVWNLRRRCLLCSILRTPAESTPPQRRPDDNDNDSTTAAPDHNVDDNSSSSSANTAEANAQALTAELLLTAQLLRGFPKCYWIWNHRLWTLQQCIALLPLPLARDAWDKELVLIGKMLTLDKRNFHAWGYRRTVVAKLEGDELAAVGHGDDDDKMAAARSMVEHEFEYTRKMIRVDLSNFSAWHRRSELMGRLLDERGAGPEDRKKMLNSELDFIREGLNVGPEDQSLWYYHQSLMQHVFPPGTNSLVASNAIAPDMTLAERLDIANREIEEIRDLLEDYSAVKWVYEALVEYVMALPLVRQGEGLSEDEREEVNGWIGQLRTLDPMRNGRWDDLERSLDNA